MSRSTVIPYSAVLWLLFVLLAFIWGSSFFFIKIGLQEGLTPLTLVSYRLWIATAFLVFVLRLTGGRVPRDRATVAKIALLGAVNVALPFSLITWGELYVTSALASIFNGLVPLFTIVLGALFLQDEPITLNRLGGLVIGFAGAVLLISPGLGAEAMAGAADLRLLGVVALTVASISYGFSAVFIRRSVAGRPLVDDPPRGRRALTPVEIALPQSIVGGAITLALALALERPASGAPLAVPPTLEAWFAVTWLGVLGSGVAYLLFFRIISTWGATRSALVTYVMPVVGIALGVIVLREQLHLAELAGSVLVIGGVVLANSRVGQRRLYGRLAAGPPAPR